MRQLMHTLVVSGSFAIKEVAELIVTVQTEGDSDDSFVYVPSSIGAGRRW
jgi:hypothetical protein